MSISLPETVRNALNDAHLVDLSLRERFFDRMLNQITRKFTEKVPLEQTYLVATVLLEHAYTAPEDLRWMFDVVQGLVSKMEDYFRCSGENLLQKLRSLSEGAQREIESIANSLNTALMAVFQAVVNRGLPQAANLIQKVLPPLAKCLPIQEEADSSPV